MPVDTLCDVNLYPSEFPRWTAIEWAWTPHDPSSHFGHGLGSRRDRKHFPTVLSDPFIPSNGPQCRQLHPTSREYGGLARPGLRHRALHTLLETSFPCLD